MDAASATNNDNDEHSSNSDNNRAASDDFTGGKWVNDDALAAHSISGSSYNNDKGSFCYHNYPLSSMPQ